jgi:ABC-type nitrate/sulfonate/bicarbonate transport system substrate-binding protein
MSRRTAFAAALALALLALPRSGSAVETIVLQLSGPATFEFVGYYAALWQGYYRDAGFDVTIRPGGVKAQIPIDPVREVAEGRAQFGIGTVQLVIRRAQGLPVLLVAPIFQQSGAAVYYRADSEFSSPAALVNARIGRLPASDILDIELTTTLRAEGIDPAKLKSLTINPDQIVPALADRSIDAAIGSAWIVPWQAHERGLVLKSFNPTSYRVEYYGDSLFTLQRFATAEPDTVRTFRAATLKGWEYALQHPDDMIARLVADKPGEPPVADIAGFDRYQADVARRLARYPEIPLGYSNADRWTQIEAGMLGAGVLERNADLTSFVYHPESEAPAHGGVGRLVAIAAAICLAAAVLAGAMRFRPGALGLGRGTVRSGHRNALRLWQHLLAQYVPHGPHVAAAEPAARAAPPAGPVITLWRGRPRSPSPPPSTPASTNLNDVLAPLERRIRQRVRGKVRFRLLLLADLWPCRTEGGTVAATVLDLVDAATAGMDPEGTLIIGTRNIAFTEANLANYPDARRGEFARITVRDHGPGLSDTQFEQILDAETTVRPAAARAAATMDRLGGFVRVESAQDVGTAVHLYFPRVGNQAAAPAEPSALHPSTANVAE